MVEEDVEPQGADRLVGSLDDYEIVEPDDETE